MWPISTSDVFDAWYSDLDADAQVEVIATVELLKRLGPRLGRPHADALTAPNTPI